MLNDALANFYKRDIGKLIEEVNLFINEKNLWKTYRSVKNSSGHFNTTYYWRIELPHRGYSAHTGYIHDRNQEFIRKDVQRKELADQLEALIEMTHKTLSNLNQQQMEEEYPVFFDNPKTSISYLLMHCCFI